jgi:hypothetical protein
MKNKKFLYLSIISLLSFNSYSQKRVLLAPKILTTKYVEINVIKTYERVAEKGYKSVDMFQKLGNSFYTNFEMEKAARWYCELFAMTSDLEPKYYYQYEKALRSIGENEEANAVIEKFNQKKGTKKDNTFRN